MLASPTAAFFVTLLKHFFSYPSSPEIATVLSHIFHITKVIHIPYKTTYISII